MRYIRPVTPAELGSSVRSLCVGINPSAEPFYVDVAPKAGEPPNECFHVVNRHIQEYGGNAVIGWSIWELPSVFVEAEFHAVWRSPQGDHLDISPKNTPTRRILFLPDPSKVYQGSPLDNQRRAISAAPELRAFFEALEAKYEIMNRGGRALEHGEITFVGREAAEYESIEQAISELGLRVFSLYPEVSPYSPCLCGSGKKAKWCHGVR